MGAVGETPHTDTYYLLANPSNAYALVRVTLLFDDGTPASACTFTVADGGRLNVDVRAAFPAAVGKRFGALFESLPLDEGGVGPVPIVVEWAIYSDALGQRWAAGANALATPVK